MANTIDRIKPSKSQPSGRMATARGMAVERACAQRYRPNSESWRGRTKRDSSRPHRIPPCCKAA
eukprot:2690278-Alexandrium_andersonii.AAC.1